MQHRVFVAINLPEDIRKQLVGYKAKWPELPCRWTKKENLHITLSFLGNLFDEEVFEVCKTVTETAVRHTSFDLTLKKIVFGPPKKLPPRLVWAAGEKNENLEKLQKDLDRSFVSPAKRDESKNIHSSSSFASLGQAKKETEFPSSANLAKLESKAHIPHITLGRIKTWDLRKMELEEKPDINEEINLSFPVSSVEVMESKLKKGGPEYVILESCQLKN